MHNWTDTEEVHTAGLSVLSLHHNTFPTLSPLCTAAVTPSPPRANEGQLGALPLLRTECELYLLPWGCSRPCKRVTWSRPSRPRRRAGRCALHSSRCRCCRASWCARCAPPGSRAAPPCCPRTATPGGGTENTLLDSLSPPEAIQVLLCRCCVRGVCWQEVNRSKGSPNLPLAAHCRGAWGGCRWLH